MNHQDWKSVDIGRQSGSSLSTKEVLLKTQQAKRNGHTLTLQKTVHKHVPDNSRTLDNATEATKIEKLKCGQEIMKARVAKKLTRKQLAGLINKKEEIVAKF